MLDIVKFWRACPIGKPPFVHPDDLPALRRRDGDLLNAPAANFRQFVAGQRFGNFSDHRFHFSLLPIPYQGDLSRADIFLLQLNPGFDLTGYYAEWNVPAFRRRLERNLRQELDREEFPFLALDPEFCWSSGYRWWEAKVRDVARIVAQQKYNGRYLDALRELSQRIACIELVPYHSVAFHEHRLIKVLPSSSQVKRHFKMRLLKRASSGKVLVIAMRQVTAWGLHDVEKIGLVAYAPALSRGSSLSSRTPGGVAILERLGVELPFNRRNV